jgi:hypothetical protein
MSEDHRTQTERVSALEPILAPIPEGKKIIGDPCLDTVYRLIGSGQIEAKKAGRRTLLVVESLKRYAARLPDAKVKPSSRKLKAAK